MKLAESRMCRESVAESVGLIQRSNHNLNAADGATTKYRQDRQRHWDIVARKLEDWTGWGGYYHQRLAQIFQSLIPPGQSIVEIGCARGDLLASLKPSFGVGIDFSEEMLRAARRRRTAHRRDGRGALANVLTHRRAAARYRGKKQ